VTRLHARMAVLEGKHAALLPMLPALVLMSSENHDAAHAQFSATHDKPPELVLIIKRASAQVHQHPAAVNQDPNFLSHVG
jgi:hypothetical protein